MEKRGFVSLSLPEDLGNKGKQPKTCWRQWKQLSRFQRSLVYMMLFAAAFCLLYLSRTSGGHGLQIPEITSENNKPGPAIIDEPRAQHPDNSNGEGGELNSAEVPEDDPDSNDAEEDEEEGVNGKGKGKLAPPVDLPPTDGSLKFKGPQNERQRAVVAAFRHAWQGYRTFAWGHDHLKPISKTYQDWFNLGLTLIDSLDTMVMMNLKEEFTEARDWVKQSLDFNIDKDVNLFETTIRVFGGLLSTYHLTADRIFLDKAIDIADRLLAAFQSPSAVPYSDVNLKQRRGHAPKWSPDSSTSEVTTIQLEFRDLSRVTGNPKYEEAVEKVSKHVHGLPKTEGLVPIFINANTGKFRSHSTITLGARGDSYYEYLLKQWLQTGGREAYLLEDYTLAMQGVNNRLVKRTTPNNLLFVGEILAGGKEFKPKMDELVCFLPGTLALGVHSSLPEQVPRQHLKLAEELAHTCYLTFAAHPTHLAPEISMYKTEKGSKQDFFVKPNDAHYLLRPETIESLWYLYYITGNKTYQDWGWEIFQGIEKYTKVSGGYTSIGNVRNALDTRPKDMMESFFLGETLKYLYLLFADRHEINLSQWVFNTEAHPLPIYPQ